MEKEKIRMVWAVDPFAKSVRFQQSAVQVIEALARETPTEVLPIHVLAAGMAERFRSFTADTIAKIRLRGQSKVNGLIGRKSFLFQPLHILGKKFYSQRGGAVELIRFANKVKADFIVLSTHARKAPKRWVLGSFAETLSALSDIPTLIAPPHWKSSGEKKEILFVTDFSLPSLIAFDRLLESAALYGWRVTLFHSIDYRFYPAYAFALAAVNSYEDDVEEIVQDWSREADKVAAKAKRVGVEVNVVIKKTQGLSVAESVLREIQKEKKFLFVALASQTELATANLVGATTRQLIRCSPIPVWSVHPQNALRSRKTVSSRRIRQDESKYGSSSILI